MGKVVIKILQGSGVQLHKPC